MSMNKAIEHGKEHRKPYRRAQAVDTTCRNHGSCIYCQRNRMHRTIRELERTDEEMQEAEEEIREKALSAVKKLGEESEKNFLGKNQG